MSRPISNDEKGKHVRLGFISSFCLMIDSPTIPPQIKQWHAYLLIFTIKITTLTIVASTLIGHLTRDAAFLRHGFVHFLTRFIDNFLSGFLLGRCGLVLLLLLVTHFVLHLLLFRGGICVRVIVIRLTINVR